MPISKFALVADRIREVLPDVAIDPPAPISEEDLARVHSPEYIAAIKTGEPRELAESQKFPWSLHKCSSELCYNFNTRLIVLAKFLHDETV